MKKFVFTLQKLYDVKKSEEQSKRSQLKDLERNLANYERQKQANQALFNRQHAEYDKKRKAGMQMREVKQFGDFFQYLEKEMRRQDNIIKSIQSSIELCRSELLKLINEQRVLDRMREDQLKEYNKEVQKSEDKAIEDFMQARL